MKKLLALCLLICLTLLPLTVAQADVGCMISNFTHDPSSLTGHGPTDMVNIAKNQLGKGTAALGYSGAWCAAFVCDTAMLAGQSDVIPFRTGSTHDCTNLLNAVRECGAATIYDGANVYTVPGAIAGDLLFYYNGSTYTHVGIMTGASSTIEGNLDNCVKASYPTNYGGYVAKITVVRPAYNTAYPCTPDSHYGHFAAVHAKAITNTSATISMAVNFYKTTFSDHGYTLTDVNGNVVSKGNHGSTAYGHTIFFDLYGLTPGTDYRYQFWYVHNGNTYVSDWHAFRTTGAQPVTGVTISPASVTLAMGDTATLTATVAPSNATNKAITWSSSNQQVATVTAQGVVTAIEPGTATITATAHNGVSASVTVTVPTPTHAPLSISCTINGESALTVTPATFDVAIDGEILAQGVTSFLEIVPVGSQYEILNFRPNAGYALPEGAALPSGTIGIHGNNLTIDFTEDDSWTYADALPEDITPDQYNIEYRVTEQTTATTSPGEGWVKGDLVNTEYVASGATYESDLPLEESNTRRLAYWFFFHFCGTGNDAEHYYTDSYFHYDGLSANSGAWIASSHTDALDARYTYHVLKWADGSYAYCSSGLTCDGSYGSHGNRSYYWYKMYVYQDYTAVNSYLFTRDTGWTTTEPASYTQVRYSPKGVPVSEIILLDTASLKLSEGLTLLPLILPEDATCQDVVWSSSDPAVATVEDGVVTPVAPGAVVITCTSAADARIKAECRVMIHADQQLVLPASLTLIKAEAFSGVSAMEIVIPEGVTTIGSKAFANCENLVLVHMPDSLTAIASNAFTGSENVVFICSAEGCAADFAASNGIETIQP